MTGAREEILGRLRRAAAAATGAPALAAPPLPAATREDRLAKFSAGARAASATVARVATLAAVPDAIADYLDGQGLPRVVHLSAQPPGISPGAAGRLRCASGPMRADGDTVVTGCLAAIAEEGAVVLASGAAHAPESAFLAATHVIVVRADQLVDSLQSLWPRIRAAGERPPRMINIILGPSRTADLGVPSRLGAHGPLRVHVVLVDGLSADPPGA